MNAARTVDIYYVAHIDYILYIGGLKLKGERVIFECLQLQQLREGLEPRPHRGDGHQKSARRARKIAPEPKTGNGQIPRDVLLSDTCDTHISRPPHRTDRIDELLCKSGQK
jgi:hypothetical protein